MGLKINYTRFMKNSRGNMALIVALSIVPIGMCSGGVVDVGMWLSTRDSAQQALDSGALAASASSATDSATMQATTTSVFNANIAQRMARAATITSFNYDSTAKRITVTAGGVYHPVFGSFIGLSAMPYNVATTTLKAANGTMEVALVLDNTFSMSQSLDTSGTKLAVLKTAALGLVTTIMTTQNQGNVKLGVVPYGDYVNVGIANRSASWLNIPADYSKSTTTTSTTNVGQTCKTTTTPVTPYQSCTNPVIKDGVTITPSKCTTISTTSTTTCTGGTPTTTTKTTTTNYAWYGCVVPQWGGTGIAMPVPATPYTAPALTTSSNCLTAITPLSTSSTTVNSAINAMVDQVGSYYPNTYIAGGMLWGINILAPGGPLSTGAAYDTKNKMPRKVIVLMTDGFNTDWLTKSAFSGVGTAGGTVAQEATAYTDEQSLCTYAKSKNIEIYTIGVGVTDATSLSNLKTCATDTAHYFDVQSSAGLVAAFQTIAGALQQVRIAS